MKRLLCLAFAAVLVSAQGAAQQSPPTASSAPPDKLDQLRRGCTLGTATMSYSPGTSQTLSITGWTGGCKDGLRDGVGVLSSQLVDFDPTFARSVTRTVENGAIVRGVQVGMWCTSVDERESTSRSLTGPGLFTIRDSHQLGCHLEGWPLQLYFARETDGRWLQMDWGDGAILYSDVFVRVGELEAASDEMVARYTAGTSKIFPSVIPAESKPLDDLIDGGRFVWCLGGFLERLDLRSKNVAVLLSSRAATEGVRLQSDIRKLLASPANKAPSDKKQRSVWEWQQNALRSIDPLAVLHTVTNATIPYVRSLQPADDLSVLQTGAADYALVVDWTYDGNIVMDQKQYLALPACVRDEQKCSRFFTPHMTVYLIDKNLHVRTSHMDAIGAARGNGVSYEDYKRAPPMEWLRGHLINTIEEIGGLAEYIWESQIQQRPSAQP